MLRFRDAVAHFALYVEISVLIQWAIQTKKRICKLSVIFCAENSRMKVLVSNQFIFSENRHSSFFNAVLIIREFSRKKRSIFLATSKQ